MCCNHWRLLCLYDCLVIFATSNMKLNSCYAAVAQGNPMVPKPKPMSQMHHILVQDVEQYGCLEVSAMEGMNAQMYSGSFLGCHMHDLCLNRLMSLHQTVQAHPCKLTAMKGSCRRPMACAGAMTWRSMLPMVVCNPIRTTMASTSSLDCSSFHTWSCMQMCVSQYTPPWPTPPPHICPDCTSAVACTHCYVRMQAQTHLQMCSSQYAPTWPTPPPHITADSTFE